MNIAVSSCTPPPGGGVARTAAGKHVAASPALRLAYAWDRLLPTTRTDAEQALHTMSALARRGVTVHAVVPRAAGSLGLNAAALGRFYGVAGAFSVSHVDTIAAGLLPWRKMHHAWRVVHAAELAQADVVYTRNAAICLRAAACGLPVVYDTHRAWPDQIPLTRSLFRAAMQRPNFIAALLHSAYARDSYARLGIDPNKLHVVRNGFDPGRFAEHGSKEVLRARLGLPRRAFIATYTGHMSRMKGTLALLGLAERVPEVTFILVGSKGRGATEARARRLPNVRVLPWQPYAQVAQYQLAADVLLLPLSSVPLRVAGHTVLPMKVYQYLAAGRPILAPSTPDIAEVLFDGDNARLVPPGALDAAAQALRELMQDPALQARLAERAKACAETLTWDARAARIEAVLQSRLSPKRPSVAV
ncbi:MAG: glycosyltransferase family 4 protein [Polyangiales bacterium]